MLKSVDVWKTQLIRETEMNNCFFQYFIKILNTFFNTEKHFFLGVSF